MKILFARSFLACAFLSTIRPADCNNAIAVLDGIIASIFSASNWYLPGLGDYGWTELPTNADPSFNHFTIVQHSTTLKHTENPLQLVKRRETHRNTPAGRLWENKVTVDATIDVSAMNAPLNYPNQTMSVRGLLETSTVQLNPGDVSAVTVIRRSLKDEVLFADFNLHGVDSLPGNNPGATAVASRLRKRWAADLRKLGMFSIDLKVC